MYICLILYRVTIPEINTRIRGGVYLIAKVSFWAGNFTNGVQEDRISPPIKTSPQTMPGQLGIVPAIKFIGVGRVPDN